ncbi:MAG: hypothetical protein JW789_00185 [Candidatus Aenigmarchaeota archaeon]|nr:hypothetical protein [Candidatus Aenigmarchaeota archaeon]
MSFPMNFENNVVKKGAYVSSHSVEITEAHSVYGLGIEIHKGSRGHIYTSGVPHSSMGPNDIPVVLEGASGFIPVDKRYIKEI